MKPKMIIKIITDIAMTAALHRQEFFRSFRWYFTTCLYDSSGLSICDAV